MIKLVYCVRRLPDLPEEAFHRYWLERHGPLVRSLAAAIRARRYVQSHTIEPALNDVLLQSRGLAPPYDGITEVWWESLEEMLEGAATPEGAEAALRLIEDEASFIDFSQSRVFLTREHVIFDLDRDGR